VFDGYYRQVVACFVASQKPQHPTMSKTKLEARVEGVVIRTLTIASAHLT
jgi:hypothetical protein